jgi:hypothetical protein
VQKKVMVSQQQLDKLRAENRKLLDEARAANRMLVCLFVCLFVRRPRLHGRKPGWLPCGE